MIGEILDDNVNTFTPEKRWAKINPFPGLRPYEFKESHLFFSQDYLCDKVISQLKEKKFVYLLGGSGVGKTSLLNCAIKPALYSGYIKDFGSNWRIFQIQPGFNPLDNLAKAISAFKNRDCFDEDQHLSDLICYNVLNRGRQGLVELISRLEKSNEYKYLFIIDQFEDLFRLRHRVDDISFFEETIHYINLFLEAIHSSSINAYLVISIRSEFTDECMIYPTLADMIIDSNVIVPKMNREQLRDAVLGPLRIMNVKIDESLLVRILNEASVTEDVLPRLQHAMRHTWNSWLSQSNWNKPITNREYDASGGLYGSISVSANAIYDSLSEKDKSLSEIIFKSITERGAENKGFSRPASIKELSEITKTSATDVVNVIKAYCNENVKLLVSATSELTPDDYIDLSHDSLINTWPRLKGWVEDEAISGQMYRQLAETSAAYQLGKTGLLRPPDLQFALNWREKQQPNLQWARKYHPAFERAMVYLSTSDEAYKAEETMKRLQTRKTMRRIRSFFIVLGGTLFIALVFTILSQISRTKAENQRLLAIQQKNDAFAKSQKAEMLSKEALDEKMKAVIAANEAERQRLQAEEQSKMLAEQKDVAELTAKQALEKSELTAQNLAQISKQKDQLEQNAIQANLQKTEAEKEMEETFRKRMIAISQSLAVKSNQTQGGRQLKGLLALHSYQFNAKYGGFDVQPDIYNALLASANELGAPPRIPLRGHSGGVNAVCVSNRTNILYSTGTDGKVLSWNLNELNPVQRVVATFSNRILSIAISSNNRWLAVGSDAGVIFLTDLSSPGSPVSLKGHTGAVFALTFTKDGQQLFSSSTDKKILLWDLGSQTSSIIFSETTNVRSLNISSDGRFLAGGTDDGRLLMRDLRSNQMSEINTGSNPVYSVCFNNTGTMVATGDVKGNIKLWSPSSKRLISNLKAHTARVVDLKFSSTSDLLASSSYDGSAYIFDTKYLSNAPIVIKEPSSYIMSVAFSNDNRRVLLATNKNEYLVSWPAQTRIIADALCSKVTRVLSIDEWNSFIGNDVAYTKPCE
jgi:WD40 repeat protein